MSTATPPRTCRGSGTVPGLPGTLATENSGWFSAIPATPNLTMPRLNRAPRSKVNLLVVVAFWSNASWIRSGEVLARAGAVERRAAAEVGHAGNEARGAADFEGAAQEAVSVGQPRLPRRQAGQIEAGRVVLEPVVGPAAGQDVLEIDLRIDPGVGNAADREREALVRGDDPRDAGEDDARARARQVRDAADDHRDEVRPVARGDLVEGQAGQRRQRSDQVVAILRDASAQDLEVPALEPAPAPPD